jgi:hypothetical protein
VTQPKKEEKKLRNKKVPLRHSGPDNNNITTTKTTPEFQTRQKRRLQEGNRAEAPSSPDRRSQVFTLKIVAALKTMTSTKSLPGTTN